MGRLENPGYPLLPYLIQGLVGSQVQDGSFEQTRGRVDRHHTQLGRILLLKQGNRADFDVEKMCQPRGGNDQGWLQFARRFHALKQFLKPGDIRRRAGRCRSRGRDRSRRGGHGGAQQPGNQARQQRQHDQRSEPFPGRKIKLREGPGQLRAMPGQPKDQHAHGPFPLRRMQEQLDE